MAEGSFVTYCRVSTARQGRSGLGLEAQREAVTRFLNGGQWSLVAEFTEIESGKNNERPELAKAMQACRVYGAKLVIAKLDRLSRDAHFLLGLEKAGVDFVAADMPGANRLTARIMAVLAEEERKMISERTKAALAVSKKKLGGLRRNLKPLTKAARKAGQDTQAHRARERAADLLPIVRDLRDNGVTSFSGIAKAFTERGIPTTRGSSQWTATQVSRVVARLPA
jgi:DNA invertase Pin-like site-specific DNA recombinase